MVGDVGEGGKLAGRQGLNVGEGMRSIEGVRARPLLSF